MNLRRYRTIEKYIAEKGFEEGWIKPEPPQTETGKPAIVGPSGRIGRRTTMNFDYTVTVFERDEKVGGLLRYGIPDFKMEKHVIDRRVQQLEAEGVSFKTGIHVGKNYDAKKLEEFDAVVLCGGATQRRPLPIDGADADGVVQAMEFLAHNNRVVDGLAESKKRLSAKDKHVIVIGGGDTGSDCRNFE